jgi:hypothetical protein
MGGWVVPDLALSERIEKKVSPLLGIKLWSPRQQPVPVSIKIKQKYLLRLSQLSFCFIISNVGNYFRPE